MFKVLVIGAGFVSYAFVEFMLKDKRVAITIADKVEAKAKALADRFVNKSRCKAFGLDVNNKRDLQNCVCNNDLIISLIDATLHEKVAGVCLDYGKNLITTSYLSKEMKELDQKVRNKNLIFLNEAGLDPGIDHMMIMNQIDRIHKAGGKLERLQVYGSSLPAHECNNNPIGYKISWSAKGFLTGMKRDAEYIRDGMRMHLDADNVLENYTYKDISGLGTFESYPYGNAAVYRDYYEIPECGSIVRNTLRHIGSCESWVHFKRLGFLEDTKIYDFDYVSIKELLHRKIGINDGTGIEKNIAGYLGIHEFHPFIKKLDWLGLLDDKSDLYGGKITMQEAVCQVIEKKLKYEANERDMVILRQEMIWRDSSSQRRKTNSQLVLYGSDKGSATADGVGITAALSARMLMDNKIKKRGVIIPVMPEFYEYILPVLKLNGIRIEERTQES